MHHGVAIALCLIALLALMAGAARMLFGSKLSPRARPMVGHTALLGDDFGVNRGAADIMFGTANSPSALQEGWSLIKRSVRARSAVRLSVR